MSDFDADERIERTDTDRELWRDAELVNHLYHEERMSGPEIAEELGCSVAPIYDRIEDTRTISEANEVRLLREPARFATDREGYERVRTKIDGRAHSMALHRLLAVSEYGTGAVIGNVVHHKTTSRGTIALRILN